MTRGRGCSGADKHSRKNAVEAETRGQGCSGAEQYSRKNAVGADTRGKDAPGLTLTVEKHAVEAETRGQGGGSGSDGGWVRGALVKRNTAVARAASEALYAEACVGNCT